MENNNRKRMYELGEWLEKFIDRNLTLSQLRDVYKNGMKLYGFSKPKTVILPATTRDLGIKIAEETKVNMLENMMFHSISEFTNDFGITLKEFGNLFRPLYKIYVHEELFSEADYKKIEEYRYTDQWDSINSLICYHNGFFLLLKDLSTSNTPWSQKFAEIRKTRTNLKSIFNYLSNDYALLCDYYCFDNLDQFVMSKSLKSKSLGEEITTIIARSFLDFLKNGGQKYIIFCKHCGCFSSSKRLKPDGSPKKIFCSDICRTAYKRV